MPCRDYGRDETTQSNKDKTMKTSKADKEKIDKLTNLLCYACKSIDNLGVDYVYSKELRNWWYAHKEQDNQRIKDAKKTALAKLTSDEKEALGIKETIQ